MPSGGSLPKPAPVLSRLKDLDGHTTQALPELRVKELESFTAVPTYHKTRTSGFNRPIPVISKSTSTKKTITNKFSEKIIAPDPYMLSTPAETEESQKVSSVQKKSSSINTGLIDNISMNESWNRLEPGYLSQQTYQVPTTKHSKWEATNKEPSTGVVRIPVEDKTATQYTHLTRE